MDLQQSYQITGFNSKYNWFLHLPIHCFGDWTIFEYLQEEH